MSASGNNAAASGNFDFPPASGPSTAASRSTRHLLHQRLRDFNTIRAQQETTQVGQREPRRAPFQDRTPAPPPPMGRNGRPFNRRTRGGPLPDPRTSRLMDRLHSATSDLDTLLDQPIPRIGSPDMSTREYSGEAEVNRQRKRRKIEHQDRPLRVGMNGFRYGHRGSVAPGPLRMGIVSCDGGIWRSETARAGQEYLPENVLRNDRSVYCTTANRCNIILRHKDETTFTLNKIVIKAPARGFAAPIQEGLIFITMTFDNLISSTAPYIIRSPTPHPGRDGENQRPPSRRRDSASRLIPPPISHFNALNTIAGTWSPGHNHEHYSPSSTLNPASPTTTTTPPPQIPGFEITTHCDSPSSDEEEPSSAATLADRQRRDQAPPPYMDHSTDSEDMEDGIERVLEARALGISPRMLRGDIRGGARDRRRTEPSRIECRIPSTEAKAGGSHEQQQQQQPQQQQPQSSRSADGEQTREEDHQHHQQASKTPSILPPHARFFIEHEKNVVSVKFEPAVTGKFILLKLWSPNRDQNIDIQSIIAYGYAGPRYFPAGVTL